MRRDALGPAIDRALKDLQFGSVQLIVHEGEVVRIERVERIRLPTVPPAYPVTGTADRGAAQAGLTGSSGSLETTAGQPTASTEGGRDERTP